MLKIMVSLFYISTFSTPFGKCIPLLFLLYTKGKSGYNKWLQKGIVIVRRFSLQIYPAV